MFTPEANDQHRKEFIEQCRQKAWGAACHIDWISKGLDAVLAEYTKLQEEDRKLEGEIKTLETALDSHTVDNRKTRKDLQVKRNTLTEQTKWLGNHMQLGQKALMELQQSVETNLSLATHAEGWEWKEASSEETSADEIEDEITETHGNDKYRFTRDWVDRKAGTIIPGVDIGDGVIFRDLLASGTIELVRESETSK